MSCWCSVPERRGLNFSRTHHCCMHFWLPPSYTLFLLKWLFDDSTLLHFCGFLSLPGSVCLFIHLSISFLTNLSGPQPLWDQLYFFFLTQFYFCKHSYFTLLLNMPRHLPSLLITLIQNSPIYFLEIAAYYACISCIIFEKTGLYFSE